MSLYIVLILVLIYLITQTGSVGYTPSPPPLEAPVIRVEGQVPEGFVPLQGGVTHDDVNKVVKTVTAFVTRTTDLCVYPIETSQIEKLMNTESGSELVKVRFMYMVTNTGFPFVFGLSADVLDGVVVRAQTQELYKGGKQQMVMDNFLPFSEVENFQVYSR